MSAGGNVAVAGVPEAAGTGQRLWLAAMPWLFVVLWSTGFIVAKYGLPYAEPMTFLFLRFAGVLVLMVPFVVLARVPLPRTARGAIDGVRIGHIAVSGLLLQAGYLGGVWAAIKLGMPAGLSALIVGMQPVLTAMVATRMGERVRFLQWLGLVLGLVGVGLVVSSKLSTIGLSVTSLALAVGALASITAGTLYQKHFCPMFDLRMGAVIQFGASAVACLPFMFAFETREVHWNLALAGALAWSIVALSLGAISLLFLLIRRGAAMRVSSLMYLTPPTTAVMAWLLFGERFSPVAAAGMAVAAVGVAFVIRRPRS
ncbi:DMT family transporter [Cupriavidus pauculus]|uniref:DMT family transporter n=2 Tax=Cupriavidus pauculus TaxID=82633 RepID=A0A5P2H1C7_9BURK|nr:DMT family transporter [Cupriavidus pauculus]